MNFYRRFTNRLVSSCSFICCAMALLLAMPGTIGCRAQEVPRSISPIGRTDSLTLVVESPLKRCRYNIAVFPQQGVGLMSYSRVCNGEIDTRLSWTFTFPKDSLLEDVVMRLDTMASLRGPRWPDAWRYGLSFNGDEKISVFTTERSKVLFDFNNWLSPLLPVPIQFECKHCP